MLDAIAGSAPKFLRANGTIAPATPLMRQLMAVARNTTTPSITAGLFTMVAKMNIAITPAQLTLDVFVNGRHDVAFGNNALMLISHDDGVYVFSAFGGFAIATLDTRVTPASFSWHVQFGVSCPDQNPFNSLTFFGVAIRGGG